MEGIGPRQMYSCVEEKVLMTYGSECIDEQDDCEGGTRI